MHSVNNTCKCMHTLRKKCICTRACAPMQRRSSFFAMEAIANLSWVLREHRAGCRFSYLSNEAFAHRVRVDATCSPSRLPVTALFLTRRLLSSFVVVYFACLSIAFFTNSWVRSRKESVFHTESMSSTSYNSRLSTCVFACRLSRLLRAGLSIFVKRCCTISRTSFTSSAPTPSSFMIFGKSARKSHTLPPAKLLRQNSNGLASDFCLRSAFDVISSDPLSSDVSFCVELYISYHIWCISRNSHTRHVITRTHLRLF